MKDQAIWTKLRPSSDREKTEPLNYCFTRELSKSDRLEIAVGFCSYKSLLELERLILQKKIKKVCLILGMYYFNGMSKYLHSLALRINRNWKKEGIGEIRLVHSGKYHGKLYFFFRNNQMFSAIIGSPNLSFLDEKPSDDPVQYEIASLSNNPGELQDYLKHLEELKCRDISENIEVLEKYRLYVKEDPHSKGKQKQSKIIYTISS